MLTGYWFAPTSQQLNDEDFAAYQEDYRRRRQKLDKHQSSGEMFNAESWHFYGAVGDSLKWFYYWYTLVSNNKS